MAVQFGNHPSVPCYRSLNLLAHAQMEELDIGSRCGGYGECGGDRIQVLQGLDSLSSVTEAERRHLSEEELSQGYRLACQCFPEQDLAEFLIKLKA